MHYVVFDLLHLDGAATIDLPYERRRDLLADLGLVDGPVMVPAHFVDRDPAAVMVAAQAQGLEGIVIKRLDSVYQPGRRSRDWIKVPINHTQEVVIIGYKPGQGRRAGTIGSLMLAVAGPGGQLTFVGGVGTGFTDQTLKFLRDLLVPLARSTAPVGDIPRELSRGARWVEPRYVGEVTYRNWTDDGHLRHCSWRGLRPDKSPAQTVPAQTSAASVELSMRSHDQQWLVEVIRVGPITYCRITHGSDVLDWIPDIAQVQAILDREHVSLADLEVVPNCIQPASAATETLGRTATG